MLIFLYLLKQFLRIFKTQVSSLDIIFALNLNHIVMKKYLFIIMLTICTINYTRAQNKGKNNTPKEEIKVNKEYDENASTANERNGRTSPEIFKRKT
jgi:hypothetical protein